MQHKPAIWWIRRDLRLADNPTLMRAIQRGRPVIPVYVLDEREEALGAAASLRLMLGLKTLAKTLESKGSYLIFRRGDALAQLRAVAQHSGADTVCAARAFEPADIQRDTRVTDGLRGDGIQMDWGPGNLLFDPLGVQTGAGQYYRVYTPYWRAVRGLEVPDPVAAPGKISSPEAVPPSDSIDAWHMDAAMNRGAAILTQHCMVGEESALDRLHFFTEEKIAAYAADRDFPAVDATSGLSENLAWGEISPIRLWHAGQRAMAQGRPGAETFLKEVVWREFAYHLAANTPQIMTGNWRDKWDSFPWSTEEDEQVLAWKQGRTGVDLVDAAMRELYVTGRMHNRLRMLTASFLTKHMMKHWKIGLDWFADCLIDWDPASNAMGWQWVAGSGPDAAPFFRIFSPLRQQERFDPKSAYVTRWLAEGQRTPSAQALAFFEACPRSWDIRPNDLRPLPILDLKAARQRALDAYSQNSQ